MYYQVMMNTTTPPCSSECVLVYVDVALYHWINWKNKGLTKLTKKKTMLPLSQSHPQPPYDFLNESCLEILHFNAYRDLLLLRAVFFLYWTLLQCIVFCIFGGNACDV